MLKRLILIMGLFSALVGSVYLTRIPATDRPRDALDWSTLGYAVTSD